MAGTGKITPPEKLTADHNASSFDSGVPQLDDWLKRRAVANEESGASRTYVISAAGRVIGYYALASGAIAHNLVTAKIRRNMPEPIPVMVLGRLAVDRAYHGQRLGAGLLRNAILRTLQASKIAGIRAILVHAVSEEAKQFYERCGFSASPVDPMTLMIRISDAEKALGGSLKPA